MTDDNSILETPASDKTPATTVTDYLGGLMSSLHATLDPSAIITPQAVRTFSATAPAFSPSQPTPRTAQVQVPPLLKTSTFGRMARVNPETTFMNMTTFHPQQQQKQHHQQKLQLNHHHHQQRVTPSHLEVKTMPMSEHKPVFEPKEMEDAMMTEQEDSPTTLLTSTSSLTMDLMADEENRQPNGNSETEPVLNDAAEEMRTESEPIGEEVVRTGNHVGESQVNPYENLIQLATKSTLMMEKLRDEVNMLRIQNATLLNDLSMVSFDS